MSEKMREEFEARFPPEPGIRLDDDGLYIGPWASFYNARWEAWKASRESLVIELPRRGYWGGYDQECYMEANEVEESIHDAGVKTK